MLRGRKQRARGCGLRVGQVVDRMDSRLDTEQADEETEREDRRLPAPAVSGGKAEAGQGQQRKADPDRGGAMVQ